jgi:large conductance mechanosensitive channel
MEILKEFRDFAVRGNVLDLAIAVIMGAAFGPIVTTLVEGIIMPPIGYMLAGVDFSTLSLALPTPTGTTVEIKYGMFLNAVIRFIITAFAIFLLIKAVKQVHAPPPKAAPAPTPTETYLREIRDALVKKEG